MRRWWLLGALTLGLGGCGAVEKILENPPELPGASLRKVDLVKAPSVEQLAAWACFDYGGDANTCGLLGFHSKPKKRQMQFSFDLVFDLTNPNAAFPIPLVELLLGFVVYKDQNLGAICVSFCDPDQEDCSPADTPEGACRVEEAEDLTSIDDLIPTVPDLLDLADELLDGSFGDNFAWRTIPAFSEQMCHPSTAECAEEEIGGVPHMCCDDTCEPLSRGCRVGEGASGEICALCDGHVEAHIGFDLEIDAMLSILEKLFEKAVDDLLAGDPVRFVIPYEVEGTLFFDIPKLGRKALGFGPFDDKWKITP